MTTWTPSQRALFVVPQIFTAVRLVVSGAALLATVQGDFLMAVRLVVAGAVVDSFDGPIAKKLGVTSDFGALFDYFGDYIGNVVVPSLLVFFMLREWAVAVAVPLSLLVLLTGGIRYARNAMITRASPFDQSGYPGLGTVFFALFMVEVVLLELEQVIGAEVLYRLIAVVAPIFALSQVGWWRYPKFSTSLVVNILANAVIVIQLFVLTEILGPFVLVAITSYGLFGPLVMRAWQGISRTPESTHPAQS
jgi:CDP-diacylglycerol--serine O-phosphatidyltransferase